MLPDKRWTCPITGMAAAWTGCGVVNNGLTPIKTTQHPARASYTCAINPASGTSEKDARAAHAAYRGLAGK
jgi:hypothetical protein